MVVDLTRLFENEGEELFFSHSLSLRDFDPSDTFPVKTPVSVKGMARNDAGVVTVRYTIAYTVGAVCDRCLKPVSFPGELASEQVAVRALSGEDNEEFLVLPDAQLNLDELVYADMILELPSKILCSEDCKGLCPVCGGNLNEQICGCTRKTTDPRLKALESLLEE